MNSNLVDYKNLKISPELLPLIKYMHQVEQSREKLSELSNTWDSLSLLSQLGDAGVNMTQIKNNFTTLSSELINYLGIELLKKSVNEMESKAQVSVDIVIRNLFERTADIGFLATDTKIREFLEKCHSKYSDGYHENIADIKNRFLEYVAKYSVYFDIVLMNKNGDILVNIDPNNNAVKSNDAIIKQTIETDADYVETFKKHDFISSEKNTLVYSYKVTHENDAKEEVLGVLCLCFKFEDEMEAVFANLVNPKTKECLTLLNEDGEVIATSDKYHIPLEAKLPIVLEDKYQIISFGGRDYLCTSSKTNGYQGFYGLGWYGHIMIPLEYAFSEEEQNDFAISQELLLAILQNSHQFSNDLKHIPIQAENIQENLNRAIWNGHIKQSNSKNDNKQFSKALLQEIRKTGENTKNIIGSSMANLTKTMVLGDSLFLADLILDIMDRNLYERANDCRWWALTPDFRTILEKQYIEPSEREHMNKILAHINSLYTVYTNLFIYNKDGVIVSVSQPEKEYLIGRRLQNNWVRKTLEITDSSKYFVSDFETTDLYDGGHTYIYNASIRSLHDEKKVLGGIGIVFDAQVQFQAMIEESLPKKSSFEDTDTLFSVITTDTRTIIASNHSTLCTGEQFHIDSKFFHLQNGESLSEIVEYDGKFYALGVQCSKGYREYKSTQDTYKNDIYNFVFSYISDVEETRINMQEKFIIKKEISTITNENSIDIASFMIGSQWLGVNAHEVVEAVPIQKLKSTIKTDEDHHFKGTLIYNDSVISVIDIQKFIQEPNTPPYEEIVILKFGKENEYIGILVNALGDIPEVELQRIRPLQEYIIGNGTLVKSIVFPAEGEKSKDVLSILSISKINEGLVQPHMTHMICHKSA